MDARDELVAAARELGEAVGRLTFAAPVAYVYNPLDYAWPMHEGYLRRYGAGPKRFVFLGMNPGPFGMTQTGVPFGEIAAVRDWMGLRAPIGSPAAVHPKRPITGFDCNRSEVSGKRLWGLFAKRFGTAEAFFRDHFVLNYCPLVFVGDTGKNITPDKLAPEERATLAALCDAHLRRAVEALAPEWVLGIGAYAEARICEAMPERASRCARLPHPSPASPSANKDWAGQTEAKMRALGLWD